MNWFCASEDLPWVETVMVECGTPATAARMAHRRTAQGLSDHDRETHEKMRWQVTAIVRETPRPQFATITYLYEAEWHGDEVAIWCLRIIEPRKLPVKEWSYDAIVCTREGGYLDLRRVIEKAAFLESARPRLRDAEKHIKEHVLHPSERDAEVFVKARKA